MPDSYSASSSSEVFFFDAAVSFAVFSGSALATAGSASSSGTVISGTVTTGRVVTTVRGVEAVFLTGLPETARSAGEGRTGIGFRGEDSAHQVHEVRRAPETFGGDFFFRQVHVGIGVRVLRKRRRGREERRRDHHGAERTRFLKCLHAESPVDFV